MRSISYAYDVGWRFWYLLKVEFFEVDFELDEVVLVRHVVPDIETDFVLDGLQHVVLKQSHMTGEDLEFRKRRFIAMSQSLATEKKAKAH